MGDGNILKVSGNFVTISKSTKGANAMTMWSGVIIGAISFLIIGIFHPIVIKCEYHFSEKVWPVFGVGGILFCLLSLLADQIIISSALAIAGFSMLWSIKELKEQTRRVEKGWFPGNPKRKKKQ